MLVGFALLTVGMALLGYLVVAREPAAAAARSKSSPLRSPGVPPAPSAEDVSDVAPTLVMRARAATDGASREPRPEPENRPLPTTKSAPSRAMKVVVTYELEDDAETEVYTASKRPSPSAPAGLCLRAAGDTDRGQRRRANDDSLLVSRHHEVFAVADGMGGYAGGSVASSLAVEALMQAFQRGSFTAQVQAAHELPPRAAELASAMVQAHEAVFRAARANPAHCRMGTTLVAAHFLPEQQRVYIGHVGDSRCYRLRRGSLRQLTTDQTLSTVGLSGPHAGDLLQAVGVTEDLTIDLIVDTPQSGDLYLLCSDGLNKMISDPQIAQTLAGQRDLEATVYELIERANDSGGRDNVTVVLIKVTERSPHDLATIPSPPPSELDPATASS